MNIGNSLLYKEDFAWMKKQTLLRLIEFSIVLYC